MLFVDDDISILKSIVRSFKNERFDQRTTSSARDALETLENECVVALIYDRCMPEMDGAELAARARALHPEIELIQSSGFDEPDRLDGLYAVLVKPWSPAMMQAAVRGAVDSSRRRSRSSSQLRELPRGSVEAEVRDRSASMTPRAMIEPNHPSRIE